MHTKPLSIHMLISYLWFLFQASQSDQRVLRVGSVSYCIANERLKFQLSTRRQNNINSISFPPLSGLRSNIQLVVLLLKTDSLALVSVVLISFRFQSFSLDRA